MKPKVYRPTDKQFKLFKSTVNKWIAFFGLKEYQLRILFNKEKGCRATCLADLSEMQSEIALGTEWDYKPADHDIVRVAFHEVCELLLWELGSIASAIGSDPIVDRARHTIIAKLENSVLRAK